MNIRVVVLVAENRNVLAEVVDSRQRPGTVRRGRGDRLRDGVLGGVLDRAREPQDQIRILAGRIRLSDVDTA